MAAQGRRNVHGKTGVRFKAGYTKSKRENVLRNLVTTLVMNGKITVTGGMVKPLKSLADHLVTLSKRGDLHARRQAAAVLRDGEAVKKLFNEYAKRYEKRSGGYTRAIKNGYRRGDNAPVMIVSYVE